LGEIDGGEGKEEGGVTRGIEGCVAVGVVTGGWS